MCIQLWSDKFYHKSVLVQMIYQGPTYILFISLVYFFAPSGVGSMEVETGFSPQAVALKENVKLGFLGLPQLSTSSR